MAKDVSTFMICSEQSLQISNRVGAGESQSFNLDLLDPTNIAQDDIPHSLHEVIPINLQKGIGPSDFMPSLGMFPCIVKELHIFLQQLITPCFCAKLDH